MQIDNAIQIIKPNPDSQYRLRPCPVCGSDDVAYVEYEDGRQELWRVQCFGCGHVGQGHEVRHDAQLAWNGAVKE